jgi:hypothetical protein
MRDYWLKGSRVHSVHSGRVLSIQISTEKVQKFIRNSNGNIYLSGLCWRKYTSSDIDEIEDELIAFEKRISEGTIPKKEKIYEVNNFVSKDRFLSDIQSDY